jgi:hypothetical protein
VSLTCGRAPSWARPGGRTRPDSSTQATKADIDWLIGGPMPALVAGYPGDPQIDRRPTRAGRLGPGRRSRPAG